MAGCWKRPTWTRRSLDRSGEILISNQAEGVDEVRRNLGRNLRRNFAAKFSCLFCAYFTPPKNLPPTLHRKFHCGFVQKILVCHGLLGERFEEVNLENSTTGFRDREVCERQGGCGIHRVGTGASARSVSGASVESA